MNEIIKVEEISKKYNFSRQRGSYVSARDQLAEILRNPLKTFKRHDTANFWALDRVSFSVSSGQSVGIIGSNGSGKSTLLKVLTKITPPTKGHATIRGKVVSLLEVGTGFHQELTGRENIFLNGAILGMTKAEITAKFAEIVNFSGVEKFIDMPVKHFSSGMYVRLAFSVAAHMEPDILIVDEVLAVGDAEFQKKCLGKMDEVTKSAGRTVLLVSHNMTAIQNLCSKCIYLENGKVKKIGPPNEVINAYLKTTMEMGVSLKDRRDRKSFGTARLTEFHIEKDGKRTTHLETGSDHMFCFTYSSSSKKSLKDISFWLAFKGENGETLLHLDTNYTGQSFSTLPPKGSIYCRVKKFPLASGLYQFSLALKSKESVDLFKNAGVLEVKTGNFFADELNEEIGQFYVDHEWGLLK